MNNNRILVLSLVILVALTACKSATNKPAKAVNQQQGTQPTKTASSSNQPYWILDSTLKGHLAVVGSAAKQDFGGKQAQYRVAISKARAELAKIYRTRIESTTDMVQNDSGTSMNTATRASSSAGLRLYDAIVLEEWSDPKTGELFIWLALPLN